MSAPSGGGNQPTLPIPHLLPEYRAIFNNIQKANISQQQKEILWKNFLNQTELGNQITNAEAVLPDQTTRKQKNSQTVPKINPPKSENQQNKSAHKQIEVGLRINKDDDADTMICSILSQTAADIRQKKLVYGLSGLQYKYKGKHSRSSQLEQGHFQYLPETSNSSSFVDYFLDLEPNHRVDRSRLKYMDPSIRPFQDWEPEGKSYLIDPNPIDFNKDHSAINDFLCNTNYKSFCVGDEGGTAYPPKENCPVEAQSPQLEMNIILDELSIDHLKLLKTMNNVSSKFARGFLAKEELENIADTRNDYKRNILLAMGDYSFLYRPSVSPQTTRFDNFDFEPIPLHDVAYFSYLTYILELNGPILPRNQLSISVGLAQLIPLLSEAAKNQSVEFHLVCTNSCLAFLYYTAELFTALANLEDLPSIIPIHASFEVFKKSGLPSQFIINPKELKNFLEWIELGGSISAPIYQARNAAMAMTVHKEEYFKIATEWLKQNLEESVLINRAMSVCEGKLLYTVNLMLDEADNILILVNPLEKMKKRFLPKILPQFFPFNDHYMPKGEPGEPTPKRAIIHEKCDLEFKLKDGDDILQFKPGSTWFMFNLNQQED